MRVAAADESTRMRAEARQRIEASGRRSIQLSEYEPVHSLERPERFVQSDRIFGSEGLQHLAEIDQALAERHGRVASGDRLAHHAIKRLQVEREAAVTELREMFNGCLERSAVARSAVAVELMAFGVAAEEAATVVAKLKSSNSLFEGYLHDHAARVQETIRSAHEQIMVLKTAFAKNVAVKAAHGDWPIGPKDIERRIDRTHVSITDTLLMAYAEDAGGFYEADSGNVILSEAAVRDRGLYQVYNHEMLHAISGRDVRLARYYEESLTEDVRRSGLMIYENKDTYGANPGDRNSRGERFWWLNEAVTESAAHELAGVDYMAGAYADGVYLEEQKLLAALEQRVPRRLFMAAYFESREPDASPEAWGRLQRQVNAAFEPRLLVVLDKMIGQRTGEAREAGLRQALAYLEERYPAPVPSSGRIKRLLGRVRRNQSPR